MVTMTDGYLFYGAKSKVNVKLKRKSRRHIRHVANHIERGKFAKGEKLH